MSTEPTQTPPTSRARRAIIAGKFLPLHRGHQLVINRATSDMAAEPAPSGHTGDSDSSGELEAGGVDVVVCDRAGETPPAHQRAEWIRALHPTVTVTVLDDVCTSHGDDDCEPECSPRWAAHLADAGLGPHSHVYGSDSYIEPFADALGAEPVLVDPARVTEPFAGRNIRGDLAGSWDHLDPIVRAGLTRRVVVLGAESTGTTTLAGDLAARLGTDWVHEYGRDHSAGLAAAAGTIFDVEWTTDDFTTIADGQDALERTVISAFTGDTHRSRPLTPWDPLVVCDTDVLATAIWHRRYLGVDAPELVARAHARPPLLYVLTSPVGVAFDQDGLRDGEAIREPMTDWFRDALAAQDAPWIEVAGTRDERVNAVVAWLTDHAGPPVATAPADTAHT